MSNNIEGNRRPRRRDIYGENVVSVRPISPPKSHVSEKQQEPQRQRPWWEEKNRIKKTNVVIPEFLETGILPPVPERTDIPDLDFSASETVLQEAYDHKLFRDNPNILVKRNPETGSFVYSATEGHTKTKYIKKRYIKGNLPRHRNDQKVLDEVHRQAELSNLKTEFPDSLKIDLKKIPLQLIQFSNIKSSVRNPQFVEALLGIRDRRALKGKNILVIGSGFDTTPFHFATQGAKVVAIDPIYSRPDMLPHRSRDFLDRMKKDKAIDFVSDVPGFLGCLLSTLLEETPAELFPEDASDKRARLLMDSFFQKFKNNKSVSFISGSANMLPIANASVDIAYSTYCVSAMEIFYDLTTAAILEGIRSLKRSGTFTIFPFQSTYYPISGLQLEPTHATRVNQENRKKLIELLSTVGVKHRFSQLGLENESVLTISHSDESFRRFQNYDALLQAVTKQN